MGREVGLLDITSPRKQRAVTTAYVDIEDARQEQHRQQNELNESQQEPQDVQRSKHKEQDQNQQNQDQSRQLSEIELEQIRSIIRNNYHNRLQSPVSPVRSMTSMPIENITSMESEYTEFAGTTHAWPVYASNPNKRASNVDRLVGTSIILFQIFTYWIFANEAIRDYKSNSVPVEISHRLCGASGGYPVENFTCEAMVTNNLDNIAAFYMLGIFLAADFMQAANMIYDTSFCSTSWFFAILAGFEVFSAFLSATIAISYKLHIGELSDAIEVGVGLLFIREISSRAYAGLRYKKKKQYTKFFLVVFFVVLMGFILDPTYEALFVPDE